MKAIIKKNQAKGLVLSEAPMPTISEDEVLIKVKKTSICGTDVHIDQWDAWAQKTIKTPLIIGHEFVGIVEKIGKNVKGIQEGDRVTGEGHIVCGKCRNCLEGKKHLCPHTKVLGIHRPGCFSEYFTLPKENVFLLPKEIPDDIASIFDPFGNAVHTTFSFTLTTEDVLITGAGPIGMMAAAISRFAGAKNVIVTDINPYRLDLAKKMGATCVVDVSKVNLKNVLALEKIEYGCTRGFEMSGNPDAFRSMLENLSSGGKVALLGILPEHTLIDWDLVIFKMLEIKGIFGREIFSTWFQMLSLLNAGLDLSPIITHHYPYHEFEKGFSVMQSGQCGKVILEWS